MATLLLLRHGQIRANRQGRWHGSTDSRLTWRGRRQAKRTGRYLRTAHPNLAAIYTSPQTRSLETAELIASELGLAVEVEEALREYDLGEWEGTSFRDLAQSHDFYQRIARDPHFAPPGGESLHAVAERMTRSLIDIHRRHPGDDQVLVIGHGAAIGVGLAALLDADPGRWTDYPVANCALTELVLYPAPYVNFFNTTHHLR